MADIKELQAQIDDFYKRFKAICDETSSLAAGPHMPEAAQQLHGVLSETEQAAHNILTAGSAISRLVDSAALPEEVKADVQAQISIIYEASSFQDISGQRIKKVILSLQELEAQLDYLSKLARGEAAEAPPARTGDPLLNGPQLAGSAPSQTDVDALFN